MWCMWFISIKCDTSSCKMNQLIEKMHQKQHYSETKPIYMLPYKIKTLKPRWTCEFFGTKSSIIVSSHVKDKLQQILRCNSMLRLAVDDPLYGKIFKTFVHMFIITFSFINQQLINQHIYLTQLDVKCVIDFR